MRKSDLKHIAEDLIEDLRKMDDGSRTTTSRLLMARGYTDREFSPIEMIEIHDDLFKAAKANHITLDMSEHDGKVEGLPFNLEFIVRKRDA
ncbi:MAG: hypothetical protein ACI4ET_03640 [Bilifractor sp.]